MATHRILALSPFQAGSGSAHAESPPWNTKALIEMLLLSSGADWRRSWKAAHWKKQK